MHRFYPTTVTVSPKYKNDSADADAILALWMADRDFLNQTMSGGTYVNKSDIDRLRAEHGIKRVQIRYNRNQDFILLNASDWTKVGGQTDPDDNLLD